MAERLDIAVPIPATTCWRVKDINLSLGISATGGNFTVDPAQAIVEVVLVGDNGKRLEHRFTGQAAHNDIIALNKVNLSTKSLQKRILEKLVADGLIDGTISGSAD